MSLSRSLAGVFTYIQEAASSEWTVVHNLGYYPICDVYTVADGVQTKMMPQNIAYVDANTCVITFSKAFSGIAVVS